MATQRYAVTAGPSRFDLMLALFEGKRISFTLEKRGRLECQVLSVGQYSQHPSEDEEYRVEGLLAYDSYDELSKNYDDYQFVVIFDCRTRKGEMIFQANIDSAEEEEFDDDFDEDSDTEDYEEGNADDALTDFVESWSPMSQFAAKLKPGDEGYDEPVYREEEFHS